MRGGLHDVAGMINFLRVFFPLPFSHMGNFADGDRLIAGDSLKALDMHVMGKLSCAFCMVFFLC
jgi:hypothetical protein